MPIFKARPASPSSSRTATTDAMGRGRARLPTLCLQATALGLKYAFINQPVEVQALRRQFASYLGIGERRPTLWSASAPARNCRSRCAAPPSR